MIVLTTTSDAVRITLGEAHTTTAMRLYSSYRDITTTTYAPGRNATNSNGTSAVDVVAAPAASTQRVVDLLAAYNTDTVNHVVTVSFYDGSTNREMFKVTLAPAESLTYVDGTGFSVFATSGAVKTMVSGTTNPTSSVLQSTVLGADVVNNNAVANSIASVTGLSFDVVAGNKYYFWFVISYTAAATTTGSRWSITGPATSYLAYTSEYSLAATTQTVGNYVAYDNPAACNATSAATTGNTATIEGLIVPSANGTVIARFASEVGGSAITAKAGSVVYFQQVA